MDETAPKSPFLSWVSCVTVNHRRLALDFSSQVLLTFVKLAVFSMTVTLVVQLVKWSLIWSKNPPYTIYHSMLGSNSEIFAKYDTWHYGSGENASAQKEIIGSVQICVRMDQRKLISIRSLVNAGSSGLVIGWNIIRPCKICHITRNPMELTGGSGDFITSTDVGIS